MHPPQKPGPPDMEATKGILAVRSKNHHFHPSGSRERRAEDSKSRSDEEEGAELVRGDNPRHRYLPRLYRNTFCSMCTRVGTEKAVVKEQPGVTQRGIKSPKHCHGPEWPHQESRHMGKNHPRAKSAMTWKAKVKLAHCDDVTAPHPVTSRADVDNDDCDSSWNS